MELVRSAFSPVPILVAPWLEREVVGAEMLERLAGELFSDQDPAELLYRELSQELSGENGTAMLPAVVLRPS